MNYPQKVQKFKPLDGLTGIKSSLGNIREIVALLYLLFITNDRKSHVDYCLKSNDGTLNLKNEFLSKINLYLGEDFTEEIKINPLLTKQYEPLYVGVTVLLRLALIKMDMPNAAERKGGKRFIKHLDFSTNMLTLDLLLSGFSHEELLASLKSWLRDEISPIHVFEERVGKFLSICSQYTIFKIRNEKGHEIFFQTEGLFKTIIENGNATIDDSVENVGPNRIYRNIIKEGLEPWLTYKNSEIQLKDNVSPSAANFLNLMETAHLINNISIGEESESSDTFQRPTNQKDPLQVIYYGAPGTGKSHAINTLTSDKSVIRTTFHPDSDYSTFVGAYKPTTEEQERYNDSGVPVIYHDGDHKGEPIKDKVIVYDFVEQAFLKAYEEAWKKFFANLDAPKDEYLVIEEINRGNCAQIFGDLFQLLDRNEYGYSEYPITADNDISKHLKDVFTKAKLHLDDHDVINNMYNPGDGDVAQKVLNGDILLLPKNLYIWATMNTSDQSLFPIDSAFKRRWDWKYQPITRGMDADGHDLNWRLEIDDEHQYDWWSVRCNINSKIIGKLTKSEDKKLGYFFCKANSEGVIDKDIFVEKVLFYLWNEILKDYEPSQDFLKDESLTGENDDYLSYDLFYDTTSGKAKIIGDRVNHLLANLKIEPWGDRSEETGHTDQNEEQTDIAQEKISE